MNTSHNRVFGVLFPVLLFFCGTLLLAQNTKVTVLQHTIDAFPAIALKVQVLDKESAPLKDVKSDQFTITLNGKKTKSITAQRFEESGKNIKFLICLDISGTMQGAPLDEMKGAVRTFIRQMRSSDELAIAAFSDTYTMVAEFSSDKNYLNQRVDALTADGNYSEIFDAMIRGTKHLKLTGDTVARALIVITDGKNESRTNAYTAEDVIREAKDALVPIFTIGYTRQDQAYFSYLEKISAQTGGTFYPAPNGRELESAINKMYRLMLDSYSITCEAECYESDGKPIPLSITVDYNKESSVVSKDIIIPAGKKAACPLNWVMIGGGAGIVFAGLGVLFFFLGRKAKKKKSELQKLSQEKAKQAEREAEELKRHAQLQQQLQDIEKKNEDLKKVLLEKEKAQTPQMRETKMVPEETEKTIVLNVSSNPDKGTRLRMEILNGNYSGKTLEFMNDGGTIGRRDDNMYVLKEETISGYHCVIRFADGIFSLEDLNSSNGSYINARKVNGMQVLKNGDLFSLGRVEGRIKIQ
mgnify:FL=1